MPAVTTLNFSGRTEAALKFYAAALQAETVFLLRFRDQPGPHPVSADTADLIFHATFRIEGTEFMASDVGYVPGAAPLPFSGFAVALQLDTEAKAERCFAGLSDGGHVVLPLAASAFTGRYGIVTDRFGLTWKINVARPSPLPS